MSQENVEIVRQIYAESAEGRFGAPGHLFDKDMEYIRSGLEDESLGMTVRARGLEQAFTAAMEWIETFDHLRVKAERFIDVGESVVVLTRHAGTAKMSGLAIDEAFADVLTLHEGRVVRITQYRDRTKALEAVGLRE